MSKLRLSKPLTLPEGMTVYDASLKMAARRVDAVLLTDTQGMLSGIVTNKVNYFLISSGICSLLSFLLAMEKYDSLMLRGTEDSTSSRFYLKKKDLLIGLFGLDLSSDLFC